MAHEGHQGVNKNQSLITREGMVRRNQQNGRTTSKSWLACQVATPEVARESLQMSPLPDQAWDEISVDFAELSTGDYLLVLCVYYSRYPIVEVIRSVAAQTVIPKRQHIFSQFGIPGVLISDNCLSFNSEAFATFATNLGFTYRKITLYWPRANEEVERFMRTVKKIVKLALAQYIPWWGELTNFLRSFRATPHSSTGKATATVNSERSYPRCTPMYETRQRSKKRTRKPKER